jgi:hypothetical protein
LSRFFFVFFVFAILLATNTNATIAGLNGTQYLIPDTNEPIYGVWFYQDSNCNNADSNFSLIAANRFNTVGMDLRNSGYRNVLRFGLNESLTHAKKKLEICHALMVADKEFFSEAKFKNGSRADVFVTDNTTAIEVTESEKPESIDSKRSKYPVPIVTVSTEQIFKIEAIL